VELFTGSRRISYLKSLLVPIVKSSFPLIFSGVVVTVLRRYLFLIITANIPLFTMPMMFYSYVLFNALLF
jgi:hypothetical protein